jgi:molybdopterin-binding protein
MAGAALSLAGEGLRRSYRRGSFLLDVPHIAVPAGKVLALLGPSGCGKSTLLNVLGLLDRPSAGRVLLDGREASTRDRWARLQMAAVFQRPYLFKGTVGGNVAYGLSARRVPRSQRAGLVAAVLERVGLAGSEQRSALALSGGEAQRVALARALVVEPRVLLVDEPLASLDPLLSRQLTQDFAEILRASGVTVLYVTHDQNEAEVVADRIAIMRDGRIVSEGESESVLGAPDDAWQASFLGMEPPLEGVIDQVEGGLARIDCGGVKVFAVSELPVGSSVLVGIRPEDILLFEPGVELPHTSAQNRLEGTVAQIDPRGATARIAVIVRGLRIAASVSSASVASLHLDFGSNVTLLFKATAVRVRGTDRASIVTS